MQNQQINMVLVGHYHFSSKDKSHIYYVIQCLYVEDDISRGTKKGTMINIFTDDLTYQKVSKLDIGSALDIEVKPNLNTGKVNYKVVI